MPVYEIGDIAAGSDVFLDTNVLVYGITAQSRSSASFLERCSTEEVLGISSYEVLAELTHKLMLIEAQDKGLFRNAIPCGVCQHIRDKGPGYLNRHPNEVRRLTTYWRYVLRVLDLNILWLQSDETVHRNAQQERQRTGLLTNDSIILALMNEYAITNIATNDGQFELLQDVSVYRPRDLNN